MSGWALRERGLEGKWPQWHDVVQPSTENYAFRCKRCENCVCNGTSDKRDKIENLS
jgi:hypothetical protein